MANWSDLPQELLYLISLLLTTSFDTLRFRSVCSNWRAAVPSPPCPISGNHLAVHFPKSLSRRADSDGEYLILNKCTIYALQSPSDNYNESWIIKFGIYRFSHPIYLYKPLTLGWVETLPQTFPRPFSFLNLRVRELGEVYAFWYHPHYPDDYMTKVAVLKVLGNTFVMLLTKESTYVLSKSGNEEWRDAKFPFLVATAFDNEEWRAMVMSSRVFDDVIVMGDKFYVVGHQGGWLARVNPIDLSVEIIVDTPIRLRGNLFLVECEGYLLLVRHYYYEQTGSIWCPDEVACTCEEIQVFKLNENSGTWMKVNDVGDMILFIGEKFSFSASAKDVFGETTCCKGNSIIFWNEELNCAGVFNLETESIKDLDRLPDYSKLFWPPPNWAYSPANN